MVLPADLVPRVHRTFTDKNRDALSLELAAVEMDFTPITLVALKVKISIGRPDYNSPV